VQIFLLLFKLNLEIEEVIEPPKEEVKTEEPKIEDVPVQNPPPPPNNNQSPNVTAFVQNLFAQFRQSDDPFFLPNIPIVRQSLDELVAIGFPEPRAKKALLLNMLQFDLAVNWLLDHSSDPNVDDPLTDEEINQIATNFQSLVDNNEPDEPEVNELDECISKNICTYSVTGNQYAPQTWYQCYSCGFVDSEGCCVSCINVCHKGHKISEPITSTSFFCDCGASGKCKCVSQTQ